MTKMITVFLMFAMFSPAFAKVKIFPAGGDVMVGSGKEWHKVSYGMELPSGKKVETSAKSMAIIVIDGTTRIWVSPASQMVVSVAEQYPAHLKKDSILNLIKGKIRAKFKLSAGRKFLIKTPVSIAAIRGTEIVQTSEGQLYVLEGIVEYSDRYFKNTVTVENGNASVFNATQGKVSEPKELTITEKEQVILEYKEFEKIQIQEDSQDEPANDNEESNDKKTDATEIVPEPPQQKLEEASPSIP